MNKRYANIPPDRPLTEKEMRFCEKWLQCASGREAAIYAGYKERSAHVTASQLLSKPNVARYIAEKRAQIRSSAIASAEEVMEYFTQVMKGEIKDQFGLEASLAERTKAAQELAKRTVDIEQRKANQQVDNVIAIKLDWSRDGDSDD